jgi:predicted nucleotidyltransferase
MSKTLSQTQDPNLQKITELLKSEFQPLRLFLYGSRANGTPRADSDYDFVMVLEKFDSKNRYEMMSRISSLFHQELNVEVQVWTYSAKDFDDWKDEFSSIPETALNTGKEIDLG